jgi:tight adherence protein B
VNLYLAGVVAILIANIIAVMTLLPTIIKTTGKMLLKIKRKFCALKNAEAVFNRDLKIQLFILALSFVAGLTAMILTGSILFLFIVLITCVSIPKILSAVKTSLRRRKFLKQFLPVLNQIANIVRTGSTIEEAFSIVARENPAPISEEFGLLTAEYRICHDLPACLSNLTKRMKSEDLTIFSSSIIISKRTGANLVEQLENIRKTLSDRFYIEGRIKSLTIMSKVQDILSFIIPFCVIFIVNMIDPDYFNPLWRSSLGHLILTFGSLMLLIGLFLILKLSRIKY